MLLPTIFLLLVADDPNATLATKLLPLYLKEAREYSLAVESAPTRPLELKAEPVLEWSNPTRGPGGGQQGAVFLWLRAGRPAALGCFFSVQHQTLPGRLIRHELHALDTEKLIVTRDADNQWKPQGGLVRTAITDATPPAALPETRLVQMRRLAKEFTAHSVDREEKQWELRLLPTPLYRYAQANSGVIDGALFAMVSNAGTDPEVLLLLEARELEGKRIWEFACGRFSDWELHVQRKEKEVFTSIRGPDPTHLYRIYPDKIITLEGKLLARVRQTPSGPEITQVRDK
ncbi:hypothetical protein [Fimbriiglobus ruber]|uniref:Uncharacterized protein n=1 Tax=Fimbriiglobus ruber TaxID=1908690 RepID=A0A225DVD6_9BACT|nr:hypothetical protein [Fimbriiglobus ruber]OWK40137.1 hypothetical protein FRUB_05056 [Fimbriiglobus ruber]